MHGSFMEQCKVACEPFVSMLSQMSRSKCVVCVKAQQSDALCPQLKAAMLQAFVPVYEGEDKRYKAARLLPGNEYKARVKV